MAGLFEPSIQAAVASIKAQIEASGGQIKVSRSSMTFGQGMVILPNSLCGSLVGLRQVLGYLVNSKNTYHHLAWLSVDQIVKRPFFVSFILILVLMLHV